MNILPYTAFVLLAIRATFFDFALADDRKVISRFVETEAESEDDYEVR